MLVHQLVYQLDNLLGVLVMLWENWLVSKMVKMLDNGWDNW